MGTIQRLLLLATLLLPLCCGAAGNEAHVRVVHRAGDDPRWAEKDWDDSAWTEGGSVPTRTGIHWIRYHFTPEGYRSYALARVRSVGFDGLDVDSIYLSPPCAFEAFLDGRRLGGNGVVGRTPDEEKVGRLDHLFPVPPELLGRGEHVLALRISTFHYNFPAKEFEPSFYLANHARRILGETRRVILPLIGIGGSLLIVVLSVMLYLVADRWRPLLLCAAVSLAIALFYYFIVVRWLHVLPTTWFYPRLLAATWAMTLVAWLFPWLLLELFEVPRRAWWLAALAPLVLAAWLHSPIYEYKSAWIARAMLALSLAIGAWAVRHRRIGAKFVFATTLIGLVIMRENRRDFLDWTFFATVSALVLVVFATLGAQLRAHRRRAQEAILTTARLETELLKKNIQPHFLLNTLATIMDVIEREPKTAVRMIEALAGEFRILAGVAGERLIPLGQELELCRAHLQVMSLRKGAQCSLATDDSVDQRALVPPAMIHTLVENGLTHLLPCDGQQRFELRAERAEEATRYILLAHGRRQPKEPGDGKREGTGLRYVKARLEESFPGGWSLRGEPVAEGWRTVIEVGATGGAAA